MIVYINKTTNGRYHNRKLLGGHQAHDLTVLNYETGTAPVADRARSLVQSNHLADINRYYQINFFQK